MLGGYKTCFRVSLDPKMPTWEQKEFQKPLNEDFCKQAIQIDIYKFKVGTLYQYIIVKTYLC